MLSYALCLSKISRGFNGGKNGKFDFVNKGLASNKEMDLLRDKPWWLPINWAQCQINKEMMSGKNRPKIAPKWEKIGENYLAEMKIL